MLKLLALALIGQSLVQIPGLSLREQASSLLYDASVQGSLGLTADQKHEIEEAEKANDDRKDAFAKRLPSEAMLLESDRRFAADVVRSLDARQLQKLFVRAIKERGVAALADPEVASMVGLKGDELTKAKASVKAMDARDEALSDELASAAEKLPQPKTIEENRAYDTKMAAMGKAAAPRLRVRAAARKREEQALLASLASPVRNAWTRLIG